MLNFIATAIIISVLLILAKVLKDKNFYEKLLGIYLISSNLIMLIIVKSVVELQSVLNLVTTLFLLQMAIILFLLANYKKNQ